MHRVVTSAAIVLGLALGCGESKKDPEPNKDPEPTCTAGAAGCPGLPPVEECTTKAPTACNEPQLTYTADIKPVVDSLCLGCHKGEPDGPWTLSGYEHVANWHDLLRSAMLACSMPPADSGIKMTMEQRQLMLEWLRCGFPE